MSSDDQKIAVALGRATSRQAVRSFIESTAGLEAASVTPTVTTAIARATGGIDVMVTDSKTAIDGGHVEIVRAIAEDTHTRLIIFTGDTTMSPLDLGVDPGVFVEATSDQQMVSALRSELGSTTGAPRPARRAPERAARPTTRPTASRRPTLVLIGSSTGGPEALSAVLSKLPSRFPAPILVCQHMPASFTGLLAKTLDRACHLSVSEVTEPTVPMPGQIWIAPGDRHLLIGDATGKIVLDGGAPENSCRPSVDVLFRSAVPHFGNRTVAIMLTGMGSDGRIGTKCLADAGAHIIAQDQATSVVWGMPGAVVAEGLADEVLPVDQIADHLLSRFPARPPVGSTK